MAPQPWWLPERIDQTVTRAYVTRQLTPDEVLRLDRPVAYGSESLTERTYWESIRDGARRLFLVLADVGVPDQIFGVVDDGWGDAELPLSLADVERLQLSATRDDRLDRRFHARQHLYLVRPLRPGAHAAYADADLVPLDVVDRGGGLPAALASSKLGGHAQHHPHVDKVRLPSVDGAPTLLMRRRYVLRGPSSTSSSSPPPLSAASSSSASSASSSSSTSAPNAAAVPGSLSHAEFLDMVAAVRTLQSDHMVSYWGSYTHQGHGYILLTPVADYTLKSFLGGPAAPVSGAGSSAFRSLPKCARRELVVDWILCLVDTMARLHRVHGRAHSYIKPSAVHFTATNAIFLVDPTRLTSPDPSGAARVTAPSATSAGAAEKPSFDREWYDYAAPEQWFRPSGPGSPPTRRDVLASLSVSPDDVRGGHGNSGGPAPPDPMQQADIFSLGCIILELLSFLLKRSTGKFASFRSAKLKKGGRGGAVLDTSFHNNLGQVEEWMSGLAKDAARKAPSDASAAPAADGSHVFRGFTPMLHVVAEMLASNPFERPTAAEVRRRVLHIVRDRCGVQNPHCGGIDDVAHGMAHMRLSQPHQSYYHNDGPSPGSMLQRRTTSSSGYSHLSRNSGSTTTTATTGSSDRDVEGFVPGGGYAPSRGVAATAPQPIRWAPGGQQPSVYAGAE